MYKLKETKRSKKEGLKVTFRASDYMAIRLKKDKSEHVEHKLLAQRLIKKGLAEEIKGAELIDAREAEIAALKKRNEAKKEDE